MDERKPTVVELGVDPASLAWKRSICGDQAIEVTFVDGGWVLVRTTTDGGRLISVFDHHEWSCFVDGVKNAEFDHAAASAPSFEFG